MKRLTVEELQIIGKALEAAIVCRRVHRDERESFLKVRDNIYMMVRGKEDKEKLFSRVSGLTEIELRELREMIDEMPVLKKPAVEAESVDGKKKGGE